MDLMPSFKTSVDARVEDPVSNVDYMENRRDNFIRKKYDRKRRLKKKDTRFVLCFGVRIVIFLFLRTFYTFDDS